MTLLTHRRALHSSMRLDWHRAAGALVALACAACAANHADPTPTSAGSTTATTTGGGGMNGADSAVKCTNDPRVEAYTANMKRAGQHSMLTFTLLASTPAPPSRCSNVMKLKVTQMDGTAMTGDLTAKIIMPDHGHETSVQPAITFDPSTETYTINPAYLFMPGVWRLDFAAYTGSVDAGPPLDTGSFSFAIEG